MSDKNLATSDSPGKIELQQPALCAVRKIQENFNTANGIYIDHAKPLYGMSSKQYLEGLRIHNGCFYQLKDL